MDFLIINKKFDYNISTVSDIENLQKSVISISFGLITNI